MFLAKFAEASSVVLHIELCHLIVMGSLSTTAWKSRSLDAQAPRIRIRELV
jgi:hypothetical protein